MSLEQALFAAVAALATAVVTLFGIVRAQSAKAVQREDGIREQCRIERERLEVSLAEARREFTRVLYRLANLSDNGSEE